MPIRRRLTKIPKSDWAARIASACIRLYIRLVNATTHWSYVGRAPVDALIEDRKGFILAFWHARLLMAPGVRKQTDKRVFMLISSHRDGEIIADAVAPFGIEFIRGSTANPKKQDKNKSGATAIAQMISALNDGHVVGITPDGPRGPRNVAQMGVIRLAQLSGAPIVPAAYSTSGGWRLNTWDRFWLARPFAKGFYVAGEPIYAPADASPEELEVLRQEVEQALNAAASEADRRAGRSPDRDQLGYKA